MTRYIAQRLLAGLLTAFLVSLLIFVIIRTALGLEYSMLLDMGVPEPTEKELRMIRENLGLDVPLHTHCLRWIGGWITGNWGESFFSSEKVWESFTAKLPITLQLVAMAQAIATLIGIPAGIIMALVRSSWIDLLNRAAFMLSLALPMFWTATLLLVAGTHFQDWDPEIGYISFVDEPIANLIMFIWPALVSGIPAAAAVALMMRSSTLDVLREDYVQTTPASGLMHSTYVFFHTLKSAIVPAIVALGLTFPAVAGGALIVEPVFVLDGVGHLLYEALNQRDFPIIESLALFFAVWVIAVNTLVDILCGWLMSGARSTGKTPREEWNHLIRVR